MKGFRDLAISLLVAFKLGQPVCPVAGGFSAMLGTGVPEASIDKHGEALAPENEIGPSRQRLMTAPAGNAIRPQNGGQLQFGIFVPL